MSSDNIKETVKGFILEEFLPGESPGNLTDSTQLISSGVLSSLATLRLVAFLEETYAMEIQPHEIVAENLNSITQIVNFIHSSRARDR